MDFNRFVEWSFFGLVSGGIYILYGIKMSVQDLNNKVLTLLEKTVWHEKILNENQVDIKDLKAKVSMCSHVIRKRGGE